MWTVRPSSSTPLTCMWSSRLMLPSLLRVPQDSALAQRAGGTQCSMRFAKSRGALNSMDAHALKKRPVKHVKGMAPAFTAFWTSLLDWPDPALPYALVVGIQVIGLVPSSGIHRPTGDPGCTDTQLRQELLGSSAIAFVDELEKDLRVHPHAYRILAVTEVEIELGL